MGTRRQGCSPHVCEEIPACCGGRAKVAPRWHLSFTILGLLEELRGGRGLRVANRRLCTVIKDYQPVVPGIPGQREARLTPRRIRATRKIRGGGRSLAASRNGEKQNVTISLNRQVLKKVKILAARRETSISGLLAQEIEFLVGNEEAYERAERQAMALLDRGFHIGGVIRVSRDEWHER